MSENPHGRYRHDVDLEIDRVIARRHAQRVREEGREWPEEAVYAALSREREEDLRAQNRQAWAMYHRRMVTLHEDLAGEHAAKARELRTGDRGEGRA